MDSKIVGDTCFIYNNDSNSSNIGIMKSEKSRSQKKNQECQVQMTEARTEDTDSSNKIRTLVCNRYISKSGCDAETQTDTDTSLEMCKNMNKVIPINQDASCKSDNRSICNLSCEHFKGYESLTDDKEFLSVAGVIELIFNLFLNQTEESLEESQENSSDFQISIKNRLLIFFMKVRLGLDDITLGLFFGLDQTIITTIFEDLLERLYYIFKGNLFWPSKGTVLQTTPECFKPDFKNIRIIIDSIEFRIDIPSIPDTRPWCYSDYKNGFTFKILLGFSPSGFISFISEACGGKKSDYNLLKDSGILEKLEDDDEVLTDKSFSEFQKVVNESDKRIVLVKSPFLENEEDEEDPESKIELAKVRMHIEQIMNRLRFYNILNKVPENLFPCVDMLISMCAMLVNLYPTTDEDFVEECEE